MRNLATLIAKHVRVFLTARISLDFKAVNAIDHRNCPHRSASAILRCDFAVRFCCAFLWCDQQVRFCGAFLLCGVVVRLKSQLF
jgi:hypothetical protein